MKRHIGNAVIRNYEKRIIREFFRYNKTFFKYNTDIIISIKRKNGLFLEKREEFLKAIEEINNKLAQV